MRFCRSFRDFFILSILFISFLDSSNATAVQTKKKAPVKVIKVDEKNVAPVEAPFLSEEDIGYNDVESNPLLDIGHPGSFVGVLNRPYEKRVDLRQLEVYLLGEDFTAELSKKICEGAVEKVIGALLGNPFKHEKTEVFNLPRKGKACEIKLRDPDREAFYQSRSVYIIRLKKQTFALVVLFRKNELPGDSANIRNFLTGLSPRR